MRGYALWVEDSGRGFERTGGAYGLLGQLSTVVLAGEYIIIEHRSTARQGSPQNAYMLYSQSGCAGRCENEASEQTNISLCTV
jgi:hypothetical protein